MYKSLTNATRSFDGMLWSQPPNMHVGFYRIRSADTIGFGKRIFQTNGTFDMLSLSQLQGCNMSCYWENMVNSQFFCFPPPDRQWLELYLARTLKNTILCFARQKTFKHPFAAAVNIHRSLFLQKLGTTICSCCNEVVNLKDTVTRCCISFVCTLCARITAVGHTCLTKDQVADYNSIGNSLLRLYDIDEVTLIKVLLVMLPSVFSPELAKPKAVTYSFNRSSSEPEWTQTTMFPTEVREFSGEPTLRSLANGKPDYENSLDCLTFPAEPEGKPFLVARVDTKMSYRQVSKVRNSQESLISMALRVPWFSTGYFLRVPRRDTHHLLKAFDRSLRVQSCRPGSFVFGDTKAAKPLQEEQFQNLVLDTGPGILSTVKMPRWLPDRQRGSARNPQQQPGQRTSVINLKDLDIPKPQIFLDKQIAATAHKPKLGKSARKKREKEEEEKRKRERKEKYAKFKQMPVSKYIDDKLLCDLAAPSDTKCMKCDKSQGRCTRCNTVACAECTDTFCKRKPGGNTKAAQTAKATPQPARAAPNAQIAVTQDLGVPNICESMSAPNTQGVSALTQAHSTQQVSSSSTQSIPPQNVQGETVLSAADMSATLRSLQQQMALFAQYMPAMMSNAGALHQQTPPHRPPGGYYPAPGFYHAAQPGLPPVHGQAHLVQPGMVHGQGYYAVQPGQPPSQQQQYQYPPPQTGGPYALSEDQQQLDPPEDMDTSQ